MIPRAYAPKRPKRAKAHLEGPTAAERYRAARDKGITPDNAFFTSTRLPSSDAFTRSSRRNRAVVKYRERTEIHPSRRKKPPKGYV